MILTSPIYRYKNLGLANFLEMYQSLLKEYYWTSKNWNRNVLVLFRYFFSKSQPKI